MYISHTNNTINIHKPTLTQHHRHTRTHTDNTIDCVKLRRVGMGAFINQHRHSPSYSHPHSRVHLTTPTQVRALSHTNHQARLHRYTHTYTHARAHTHTQLFAHHFGFGSDWGGGVLQILDNAIGNGREHWWLEGW